MGVEPDSSGPKTLPGEILPTDQTLAADGSVHPLAARTDLPLRIGRFTTIKQLGSGGMGVVYIAYDEQLDRKIAIKLLHARPSRDATSLGHARLVREAQAMAHVAHPNVATVYEVGEYDGQVFLAMELVEGPTLGEWLKAKPRTWREIVAMFIQAGRGLAAAHTAGIVHRDFKPDNVLVGTDDRARVLDFGLARPSSDTPTVPPTEPVVLDRLSISLSNRLTQVGSLVGTPAYMSPEQYVRADADARSDQFSFCVSLFEALYGTRPFAGQTLAELMAAVSRGKIRQPKHHRNIPTWLYAIVARGLHVDPDDRWPDMPALLAALSHDPARRRRRLLLRLGSVAVIALAIFTSLRLRALDAEVCSGGQTLLRGIWDAEQRPLVHAALLATELPYAPDVAQHTVAMLDAYAERWTTAYTQACTATAIRKEQSQELLDRRMACLDRRRQALRALVELFTNADAQVAERAVQSTATLPHIDRCADLSYLQARIPPPEQPQAATLLAQTRVQLSQAGALIAAGRFTGAQHLVDTAMANAKSLGYAPLLAEAEHLRGTLALGQGNFAAADEALRAAYITARAADDREQAAAAAIALVGLSASSQARAEVGALWQDVATAEVAGTNDPLATADLALKAAALAMRSGDYAAAEAKAVQALHLREQVVADHDPSLISTLNYIGSALEQQGKFAAAGDYYRRSLTIGEATLGRDHPLVAATLDHLGAILLAEGRYDEALDHHQRALKIRERVFGPDHMEVASSHNSLGIASETMGRPQASEDHFGRELEIRSQHLGPNTQGVALAHANLGAVFHMHGKDDQALHHLNQALAIQERVLSPDHPETVFVRSNLALVAKAQGDLDGALEHLLAALKVVEASLGATHINAASIRQNIAGILEQLGREEEALAELEQALQIRSAALHPEHPDVATIRTNIAQVLIARGDFAAAEPPLRTSLRDLEAALGPNHANLADPLRSLAELLLLTDQPTEAIAAAERALALQLTAEMPAASIAHTQVTLALSLYAAKTELPRARDLAQTAAATLPHDHPDRRKLAVLLKK